MTKNTTDNQHLRKGLEILSINGINANKVLTTPAEYTSVVGKNYEKKLELFTVIGEEKCPLFDIYYLIEYVSNKEFNLTQKISTQIKFFKLPF